MGLTMKRIQNKLIQGTLLLTIAGFLTRLIGFGYRIFLADRLGEHLLGIYQLIFPVYGICFTIYGAGVQTTISQLVAANPEKGEKRERRNQSILKWGLLLSLTLSLLLLAIVRQGASFISTRLLLEPACAPYLKLFCLLFPFCGVSACINGYFYGKNSAKVPAVSQMLEQLFRVFFVMALCVFLSLSGEAGCQTAVIGTVVGEAGACLYNCWQLYKNVQASRNLPLSAASVGAAAKRKLFAMSTSPASPVLSSLLFLFITLTSTKLVLALLHSVEAVFIPAALKKFGLSPADALGIYGILTGIALPFILFPSTVTNSFAVMLLPAIASAQAERHTSLISRYVTLSGKYSLLIGYLFTCLFLLFGRDFGGVLFQSDTAGTFILVLSWLCPFLYLSTTFTSVINGLGKTQLTFFITVASLIVKIYFLIALVPIYGIHAYLMGSLISQILMTVLEWLYLKKYICLSLKKDFVIPGSCLLALGCLSRFLYPLFPMQKNRWLAIGTLGTFCLAICIIYFAVLAIARCIDLRELRESMK